MFHCSHMVGLFISHVSRSIRRATHLSSYHSSVDGGCEFDCVMKIVLSASEEDVW